MLNKKENKNLDYTIKFQASRVEWNYADRKYLYKNNRESTQ